MDVKFSDYIRRVLVDTEVRENAPRGGIVKCSFLLSAD